MKNKNFFGEIDNIILKEYDSEYPKKYQEEVALLRSKLPDRQCAFHHIGSTAVPNILSKPIIDIAVELERFPLKQDEIEALENLGYRYWNSNPNENHHFFFKNLPRTHHLHVRPTGAEKLARELRFRDRLLKDDKLKRQYEELKKSLAENYATDRETYTEMKSEFINSVLQMDDAPNLKSG